MMESVCLGEKPQRVGPVEVDDIKRDLLGEFTAIPAQDSVQENLQVYLRVRPFTAAESDNGGSQECVTIEGRDTVVLKPPRSCQSKSLPQTAQRFTFTQVFDPEASQRTVFDGSVRGLVRDVLTGGNCLVFTYGVTNAGKTFTFLGPDHDCGLLPRSLSAIFNSVEGRLYGGVDLKPQRCRDVSRLTPDQQAAESSSKKRLLRLLKESDRSQTSGRSTFLDGSSLSSDSSSVSEADSFCLDVDSNVRFSIWVSFCEIYNDNIHDLLEQVPSGLQKRTVLRLSQDVKGNSFIKDLRWVQVSSCEEACRVMKIGRKNQSFCSTKLNQLSSRSHSIFSIRILRVDDVGVPRVLGISELSLCDLAGSERCSRTHNTGERLKEAGNINSSLLTLGKCINAMRLNQHAKFQHHVPFRESKLTHFLQFFFCGAGRVSMVVNINQSAANFDETLNVLKFSALAQKVVVVNSRPAAQDDAPHRSARELSMIIDDADRRRNVSRRGRKSSLVAWETTLEDVLEDEGGEEWEEEEEEDEEEEEEEEESVMEGTVLEAGGEEEEGDTTMEGGEKALRLVLEAQIREEVSAEFMDLFNQMEKDYSDRLEKQKELLEERAERRVEILKNLVSKTVDLSTVNTDDNKEEALLEGIISSVTEDLEKIREDAQSVHRRLTVCKTLEQQQQKVSELTEVCQQKDEHISRLQEAVERLRRTGGGEEEQRRKRQREDEEEKRAAKKKVSPVLEEEIWRLQEENDKKEKTILELREREERRRREEEVEERRRGLEEELRIREEELRRREEEVEERRRQEEEELRRREEELRRREEEVEERRRQEEEQLRRREEEVEELKKEQEVLEQKLQELTALDECPNCDSVFSSLESERRETSRLTKENKALVNGIFQLQTQVTGLQTQLTQQTDRSDSLSQQLLTAETRLQDLESQSQEKDHTISSLRQEVKEEGRSSVFHAAMEELKKESRAALERSAQKSQQIQDLQRERSELEEAVTHRQNRCDELIQELANQKAEFTRQLQSLATKLESEGGALRGRLEELEERRRSQEREKQELHGILLEKEKLIEECHRQTETLRKELEHLKEELLRREEEEEEEKENREEEEERKVPVVEELKEELQRLQERKRGQQEEEEGRRKREEFEAVRREVERLQRLKEETQGCGVSPLRSNMADRKKTPKTTGRKRKSCEVQDLVFSENKRNRVRGNTRNNKQKTDGALQKIGELIHSSPSFLGSKAKTIIGLVSGKETVTVATKPKRGRKKLYKAENSPLLNSPNMISGGLNEEKESDHLIIKRQLRSCRK